MLISIITPTYNSAETILDTLKSIEDQSHKNIEHIIIDGLSDDATQKMVIDFHSAETLRKFSSMADEGIYDAMNKGFYSATGDIVCILNSDDYYMDKNVLSQVVSKFEDPKIDYVYADAIMVDSNLMKVRDWCVGDIEKAVSQIPHPCLWVRREKITEMSPPFDVKYSIAADLKFQLELVHKLKLRGCYLPVTCVCIKMGGASTESLSAVIEGWKQSYRVVNDVLGHGGFLFTLKKVLKKVPSLLKAKLRMIIDRSSV